MLPALGTNSVLHPPSKPSIPLSNFLYTFVYPLFLFILFGQTWLICLRTRAARAIAVLFLSWTSAMRRAMPNPVKAPWMKAMRVVNHGQGRGFTT